MFEAMNDTEKKFKTKENGAFKGVVTLRNFLINNKRAREIDAFLRNAHNIDHDLYARLTQEMAQICTFREFVNENLVVLTGRALFARLLIGDTTYSGAINYGALGTDNTAVNTADTTLGAEVARKLFARRRRTNSVCNFDFFYSQADTDGTYEEFGMFVDGNAAADSGQLFNHVLTGGWTKTNLEAMTVSVQINVNEG